MKLCVNAAMGFASRCMYREDIFQSHVTHAKNIVVYGYNAASHSLGVAMHSGSGGLCRGRRPQGLSGRAIGLLAIVGHAGGRAIGWLWPSVVWHWWPLACSLLAIRWSWPALFQPLPGFGLPSFPICWLVYLILNHECFQPVRAKLSAGTVVPCLTMHANPSREAGSSADRNLCRGTRTGRCAGSSQGSVFEIPGQTSIGEAF